MKETPKTMTSTNPSQPTGRTALFAGSFDPFTIGHDNIARRALEMFDRIVIAVSINPQKHCMLSAEERVAAIKRLYADEPRISVVENDGMTADIARKVGARFNVRGVRSTTDFEYEKTQAEYNKLLGGLETVLLYSPPELSAVSSTAYRTLVRFNKDASWMLPHANGEQTT